MSIWGHGIYLFRCQLMKRNGVIYLSTPLPLVHRLFPAAFHSANQQSKVVAMIGVFHVTLTFLVTTLGSQATVRRGSTPLSASAYNFLTFSKFQIR